ncbi:hypothetical protein VNO78_39595 [Psophocarpus tetragonolobus]|uniref:Uncharacterized protein n=1 Tax=Psophocarpus tetragonolobus TaxID=3891 RepID=A0AAN9N7H1_PSOTE
MAEWLKRPTHNWRIRRFNSYWMHANGTLPPISLSDFCSRMKSYWNYEVLTICQRKKNKWLCINGISSSIHNELKSTTYYGTYNALQTYDHYASTGLFYSTS